MPANLSSTSKRMKEENINEKFLTLLKLCLDKHKLKEIEDLFQYEIWFKLEDDMELMWDIMILICQRLKTLNKFRFKTFESCQKLLMRLAEHCKPKELLVAFLSVLETGTLEMFFENRDNQRSEIKKEINKFFDENYTSDSECKFELENEPQATPTSADDQQDFCRNQELDQRFQSSDDQFKDESQDKKSVNSDQNDQSEILFDNCFKALLKPLETIIFKIPKQKYENLLWVIDILNNYLEKIPAPIDFLFEKDSMENYQKKGVIKRYNNLLTDYLDFLAVFVFDYESNESTNLEDKSQSGKNALIYALLNILYHPYIHLNLDSVMPDAFVTKNTCDLIKNNISPTLNSSLIGCTNSKEGLISELIGENNSNYESVKNAILTVKLLLKLEPDVFHLFKRMEKSSIEYKNLNNTTLYLNCKEVNYCIGILSYICFIVSPNCNQALVPSVYSSLYIFINNMQNMINLLDRSEQSVHLKGLYLTERLIDSLPDSQFDSNFMNVLAKYPVEKYLFKVIQFSNVSEHRALALKVLEKLINSFNDVSRYYFLFQTAAEPKQFSSVRSFLISKYKENIENSFFIGVNLKNFIIILIDGMTCVKNVMNIIENADEILSFLNFIRFLILKDQANNTGVWDIINHYKDQFIVRFNKSLTFFRNKLKSELLSTKGAVNKSGKKLREKQDFYIEVANGDEDINKIFNEMSMDDEKTSLNNIILYLDLIESIVIRVEELIDLKRA